MLPFSNIDSHCGLVDRHLQESDNRKPISDIPGWLLSMDKKLMKIDFQGTVKEYNEKLERNNINLQLELVQYGHFSPGFWTTEDSLLFYFELISGLFNNDTLFVFCSEQTECLWPVLLALMEERTMATTHWQRRQFVIHSIIKALSEEYKQQFAKLTSVSDNGRENLLVTDLYHINKAWRQMSSLKQSLDDFVGSLEKLANTWQDAANVSACDENQSLSESSYMRIADIALVVAVRHCWLLYALYAFLFHFFCIGYHRYFGKSRTE